MLSAACFFAIHRLHRYSPTVPSTGSKTPGGAGTGTEVVTEESEHSQSVSQLFHGPAPRSPLYRLARLQPTSPRHEYRPFKFVSASGTPQTHWCSLTPPLTCTDPLFERVACAAGSAPTKDLRDRNVAAQSKRMVCFLFYRLTTRTLWNLVTY